MIHNAKGRFKARLKGAPDAERPQRAGALAAAELRVGRFNEGLLAGEREMSCRPSGVERKAPPSNRVSCNSPPSPPGFFS